MIRSFMNWMNLLLSSYLINYIKIIIELLLVILSLKNNIRIHRHHYNKDSNKNYNQPKEQSGRKQAKEKKNATNTKYNTG